MDKSTEDNMEKTLKVYAQYAREGKITPTQLANLALFLETLKDVIEEDQCTDKNVNYKK